jgi:transcriptional regulator with XRE-family HTH domain
MGEYDPVHFWKRYKRLARKDLPVILKTNIRQSTLSTWKNGLTFPRADKAVQIAEALNTSVEYLVTGQEKTQSSCTAPALEIAIIADRIPAEGKGILLAVAKALEIQYCGGKT